MMNTSRNLVCPHCGAVNRIPEQRLADRPLCGKCHKPLFTGHPVELNTGNFYKYITRNETPLLIDFWAPWCGPCKMMAPAFQQAAREMEPGIRLAKVNTEVEQQLGAQLGIRSIPTMVLFSGGREIARQSGAMGTADIVRWAKSQSI